MPQQLNNIIDGRSKIKLIKKKEELTIAPPFGNALSLTNQPIWVLVETEPQHSRFYYF